MNLYSDEIYSQETAPDPKVPQRRLHFLPAAAVQVEPWSHIWMKYPHLTTGIQFGMIEQSGMPF
jgi:hypothetical protein